MWNLLKVNSRDCVSSLTTSITSLRLCSNNFLVYYKHILRCFSFCDFFFDVFIVNFKQISHIDQFFPIISFVLSPEKRCSLKLRNIDRNTSVLGSLFNKVAGVRRINLLKFLRTTFEKEIFWKISANGCFS